MAAGEFRAANVLCPFYLMNDTERKQIGCEGVVEKSTIKQTWNNKKDFDVHFWKHCCKRYEQCPVYKMLMMEKYDERE